MNLRTKQEYLYKSHMLSTSPLLSRAPATAQSSLPVFATEPEMCLPYGRLHEVCGIARQRFALWVAAQTQGPVLWISPSWGVDQLNACGIASILNPARLIFVTPRRAEDVLWSMEEALRSGVVDLAVADVPGLPGLTQVRRMHLAAETGGQDRRTSPLGLLMTPGMGGAQGVETRWALTPTHTAPDLSWRLDRLRARTAPVQSWTITQDAQQSALKIAKTP